MRIRKMTTKTITELRARIIEQECTERWLEPWFWPTYKGVQGWQGTRDIIFVGLNPSTGRFPSSATNLLYENLCLNGLSEAHITDLVKVRAPGNEVNGLFKDAELMDRHRSYLAEEIAILQPRLIVPMGERTARLLPKFGVPKAVEVVKISHFAQHIPTPENRAEFAAQIRIVRDRYEQAERFAA